MSLVLDTSTALWTEPLLNIRKANSQKVQPSNGAAFRILLICYSPCVSERVMNPSHGLCVQQRICWALHRLTQLRHLPGFLSSAEKNKSKNQKET